ncbi:hypothetical protein FQR65_LT16265 [Abscondita terminalis]|nr:hypothetical protein FQR65_LT16265 [Abscondita terminalis]
MFVFTQHINAETKHSIEPTNNFQDTGSASSSNHEHEYFPLLYTEVDKNKQPSLDDIIKDRRIVNIAHMLKEYEKIAIHRFTCTMGHMKIVKETRVGMISFLHFYCDNCERKAVITTDRLDSGLTDAFVWGSLSIGIGHKQLEEIMGVLNVPVITQNTFAKKTSTVKKVSINSLVKH